MISTLPSFRRGKDSTEVNRLNRWLGRIHVQRSAPVAVQEKSASPSRDSDHVPSELRTGKSALPLERSSVASTSSYDSGSQGSSKGRSSPSYDSGDDDNRNVQDSEDSDDGSFLSARPSQERHSTSPHSPTATVTAHAHTSFDPSTRRSGHEGERASAVTCFICQTTDMSSLMNDPQGRPLCKI